MRYQRSNFGCSIFLIILLILLALSFPFLWIIILLLALISVGFLAYTYFHNKNHQNQDDQTDTSSESDDSDFSDFVNNGDKKHKIVSSTNNFMTYADYRTRAITKITDYAENNKLSNSDGTVINLNIKYNEKNDCVDLFASKNIDFVTVDQNAISPLVSYAKRLDKKLNKLTKEYGHEYDMRIFVIDKDTKKYKVLAVVKNDELKYSDI